jgi:hypothetical protein
MILIVGSRDAAVGGSANGFILIPKLSNIFELSPPLAADE